MSTFVTSKSYHEVKKNGKLVDKKILDATYDGNKAIIDSYNNHKAYRFEIPKSDIKKMLNKMTSYSSDDSLDSKPISLKFKSRSNSRSNSRSIHRRRKKTTRGRHKRRVRAYTRRR